MIEERWSKASVENDHGLDAVYIAFKEVSYDSVVNIDQTSMLFQPPTCRSAKREVRLNARVTPPHGR